ncbi:pentatricopeptide repeat-containing protein At3g29230-like [Punica granatum]|uniref:Uncharacterized protein n=2 Tax=Punica granatum TaxID=22663 RepID=A0A218X4J8_PUNGR|nr:pentatricopeptide repeat-containing protein At3g29230-like [Punica granatum]OWM79844.1 hypothetical protein CDL15_Pgr023256 [Punica granatum]PKI42386.1 hypothetical protein CRG98_037228 [Punica granatum]
MVHSASKSHLKNPLVSLLQRSKTPSRVNEPNIFQYNSLIRAHANKSNPRGALACYLDLRRTGLLGDNYTYPFVLKACGLMMGLVEGRQVHGEVVKGGHGCDVFVVNGLIGMYGKCVEMVCAKKAFDGLESKDLVSWNLILGGYVSSGEMLVAQMVFDAMPQRDVVSWSIMIDGYGKKNGDVVRARVLFDEMPVRDSVSWNSMITGYMKVGELVAARDLFDLMPKKNVISWSIMIQGYASHGEPQEALKLFRLMLREDDVELDKVSVVGALSACAQLGALLQGRWMHMYIKKKRIDMDIVVQTALLDMYMKCGALDEARWVFDSMTERNAVSYSVMILGFGINGYGEAALKYLFEMVSGGIQGDDMTFLGALTACSHSGLVSEGLHIFDEMRRAHRVEPKLEHYGCLVDLLGRAGRLDQAREVIEAMPMKPNSALWGSFLLACWTHQDPGQAEVAVKKLKELGADDCGTYVLLSNIYADAGFWEESRRIRKFLKDIKMDKEMGKSVIEVDGNIEEFRSGDDLSMTNKELRQVLWSLSKSAFCAG